MSLVRTARNNTTSGDAFGTGTYTTASFNTTSGSLIVVIVDAMESLNTGLRGSSITLSNSLGLTQTSQLTTGDSSFAGWSFGTQIWTMVGNGSSMTVSADAGSFGVENYRIDVYEYTSNSGGTLGIGATANTTDADGDGAGSATLSSAPASNSEVIAIAHGALSGAGGSTTVGTGWTEQVDISRQDWYHIQVQTRTGSTSTSVGWDDLYVGGGTPTGAFLMAIEITESGGGTAAMTGSAVTSNAGTSPPTTSVPL